MFILFFIIIIISLGIAYLATNSGLNINFDSINKFFEKFGILIVMFLLVIMYYISYRISYKIFKRSNN